MGTNADYYSSYMKGWTAGAKCSAMDPVFTSHTDENIRDHYTLGYEDGRKARGKAGKKAAKLSGYVPSILRLADEGNTDI